MSEQESVLARRRLLFGAAATGVAAVGLVAGATPASASVTIPVLSTTTAFGSIPRRAFDSRSAPASAGGGIFTNGSNRTIVIDGDPGPIHSAVYAALSITVTQTVGSGYLTIYPADIARPIISCAGWTASNQTVVSSIVTRCKMVASIQEPAFESSIKVFCAGGSAHVILDLTAIWRETTI